MTTNTTAEIALDKLEALARAATPGPWHNHPISDDDCYTVGLSVHAEAAKYPLIDEDHMPGMKDAEFIAAANPQVVLQLIQLARRSTSGSDGTAAANTAGLPAFTPTEQQYQEWCERHDLPDHLSRDAFDDAVSLYLEGTDRAAATSAGGLRTDYYARFPEGESWAQVTQEQYEMAQRMGFDVRNLPPLPASDAGALEIACVVNRKLGDALAGRAYLLPADLAALKRFHECATDFDSGGHDVPKDVMARLREIGAVQSIGFGRHQTTAFGDYVLERCDGEPVNLPLKTLVERNADSAATIQSKTQEAK